MTKKEQMIAEIVRCLRHRFRGESVFLEQVCQRYLSRKASTMLFAVEPTSDERTLSAIACKAMAASD